MANFGDFLKGVVDYGSSRIAAANDLRDEEAKARMLARLQREEGRSSRVIQEGNRWFEVTVNGDGQEVSRRELSESEARERNRTEATADAQLTSTLIGSKSAERTLGLADEDRRREQEYRDAQLEIMRQNARTAAANAGGGSNDRMSLAQFTNAVNQMFPGAANSRNRQRAFEMFNQGVEPAAIFSQLSGAGTSSVLQDVGNVLGPVMDRISR